MGSEELEKEAFFKKVKGAGYNGVEMSLPLDQNEKANILKLIEKHGLELIDQHWETTTSNFKNTKRNTG